MLLSLFIIVSPMAHADVTISIGGNVYGGGEQGEVNTDGNVTINSGTYTGNIYGGGNLGNLDGSTTVTLKGGDIKGKVFGGARMADVGKHTFVNVDGNHQLHDLTINHIYGGNDIAGVVGSKLDGNETLPFTLDTGISNVDKTFHSFILTSEERSVTTGSGTDAVTTQCNTFIGQMFNGGNGDYTYSTTADSDGKYSVKSLDGLTTIATSTTRFTRPDIGKSYMQVNGGTFGYVYAGGNAATVTEAAVICINDSSDIVTATNSLDLTDMSPRNSIDVDNPVDLRLLSMGINISTFHTGHHFNRVFGGNNKADMAIMPSWNLAQGDIHDLYSGGNLGRMTSEKGILLEIPTTSQIYAVNVFGGCRRADVHPLNAQGVTPSNDQIQLDNYNFPAGFSARVLVRGGKIQNVYGGNDISGNVYGGNAVGIYCNIYGNVYGGGNGSYAYTDNQELKDDVIWGDFYYNPDEILAQANLTIDGKLKSVKALNIHRPNAEQVSIRLAGTEDNKTIIAGSVFAGGNSATLEVEEGNTNPLNELKIGSYVIADKVFMGNNGENMIDASTNGILATYAGNVTSAGQGNYDFSSLALTDADVFAEYMKGCAMRISPRIVFDGDADTDPANYIPGTSYIGSFYCGGNVGSIMSAGEITFDFNKELRIYDKLVGGCNSANVAETSLNAAYKGGVLGSEDEQSSYTNTDNTIKDRLTLNLGGVKLEPRRWKLTAISTNVGDNVYGYYTKDATSGEISAAIGKAVSGTTYYQFDSLEYNITDNHGEAISADISGLTTGEIQVSDETRRLAGANVYGGCYNSGHVNGNVIININSTIHDRDKLFDKTTAPADAKLYDYDDYKITERRTGVLIGPQAWDVSVITLGVFGGGYGEDSEVWGSATVNLNRGYTFQIYGGGQMGIIGKYLGDSDNLTYNSNYYTRVNLNGTTAGDASTVDETMPEAVFLYGGAYEGLVLGNTQTNLGNGRVFNSFGGSCAADIYGHSELFMGRGSNDDSNQGFPWVIDYAYGGNDVAGKIKNSADFTSRVRQDARSMVYAPTNDAKVTTANVYLEYQQGRAEAIFGGSCGNFDYVNDDYYKAFATAGKLPLVENAFVNFKPLVNNTNNSVAKVFGGSEGRLNGPYKDKMQNRSYVLVDVPQTWTTFTNTEVFGAGKNGGLGMYVPQTEARENSTGVVASAVIDLARGQVNAAYGGSLSQGMTRRTIVNVPSGSTVVMDNIFGGAYGEDPLVPCDVYQSIVNYNSGNARINGAIYGGNNNADRTLYAQVNINAPVKQSNGYDGYVYGAGKGAETWAQYTEVNLNDGASVYEVYGGGNDGKVLNEKSLLKWQADEADAGRTLDLTLGGLGDGYTDLYLNDDEGDNIVRTSQLFTDLNGKYEAYDEKYNTNVIINKGAVVKNYAYGAGKGANADVSGTTYVELNGGTVNKDIYASGTEGSVEDYYKAKNFTASATVYVRGGSCRNVYGGGWKGAVGYHNTSTTETTDDILGETHVVIGRTECGDENSLSFYDGKPVVQRNAYGAGEGGVVFGTSNLTLYNGYIGYYYDTTTDEYKEDLDDETAQDGIGENVLLEAGNIFGSGYSDNSNSDSTCVTVYGGVVRNSVYGGGEIGTVGRGKNTDGTITIQKGGESHLYVYNGSVKRNVFGGGRGYNNRNEVGQLGTSGYVFGSTDVNIYGGEIGTADGVADGDGNVFGGGNIGFVYSANGKKRDDTYYYDDSNGKLTEDCRVIVAPRCKVLSNDGIELNGSTYTKCQYVPTEELNYLRNRNFDSDAWAKLDDAGVIIHNAVFAGGNVSIGSDQLYANTTTVYGNATATLFDIYNRDLVTIGDENIGGLYGDGNLSMVDGYRELNVTNYGTDYFNLSTNIQYEQYQTLTPREKAYFKQNYKCKTPYYSPYFRKYFSKDQTIAQDEYESMVASSSGDSEKGYWQASYCTIYEGRVLNTLQRADFAGIFGSRMVLQGAPDRVPDVVDYTNYAVNRLGEVSLNKSKYPANTSSDAHGCYFGIYSNVNYLGALTSDVDFQNTVRTTDNTSYPADNSKTFYQYKSANNKMRYRNNGTCAHKLALASGIYLEITTEESTSDHKVWGPITGVIQLDLVNVSTGLGGGYVYAKNIHGTRSETSSTPTLLSSYNQAVNGHQAASTQKKYTYSTTDNLQEIETSGNFIHNEKEIIDDCFPTAHSYTTDGSPAHYWYIRGYVYVYDQYISAYTGSTSAYHETVRLPLTITPAANGELQLEDVQPNLYAYYGSGTDKIDDNGIIINGVTYQLNDPITYWDYSLLTASDQAHFVAETFVTSHECTLSNSTVIPAGYVCLTDEYNTLKTSNPTVSAPSLDAENPVAFDDVFHLSNNLGHNTGYALTYDINNPSIWNRYYTPTTGTSLNEKIKLSEYQDLNSDNMSKYRGAPTYRPKQNGVYGQHEYDEGDIIAGEFYNAYEALGTNKPTSDQATVVRAYIATAEVTYTISDTEHHVYTGAAISQTEYDQLDDTAKASFAPAYVCTNTIDLGNDNFILYGELLTETQINAYKTTYSSSANLITSSTDEAYYCTEAGLYGGTYYDASRNYTAHDSWCSLSEDDRAQFNFNYDALNLFIDQAYSSDMGLYDGKNADGTLIQELYSKRTPIEYTATYTGTSNLTYTDESNASHTIAPNARIPHTEYSDIPNEQRHYQMITITDPGTYHIVQTTFFLGDVPYNAGKIIDNEIYNSLNDYQRAFVTTKEFGDEEGQVAPATYYFCRDAYTVNEKGEGMDVTDVFNDTTYTKSNSDEVPVGTIISSTNYESLKNYQKDFTIEGIIPEETSTLYVTRESDIYDLSKDKVITVIYDYTYEEATDDTGNNTEKINEKHVVNIHIQFKTGVPTIDELEKPAIVLPSNTIGLKQPNVTQGAYEILGGGWEIYSNQNDAEDHFNGQPYINNQTQLYWYQDGYYVAYYAKTYLGKTYSNAVPLRVANYHDIDDVMKDKLHHMYVDYDPSKLHRFCKIYIDDRECESDDTKSELDLLKDFYDLSLHNDGTSPISGTGTAADGHNTVNSYIRGLANLDFILRSDVAPKAYTTWTPIGDATTCFGGNFHGDGYTVSGLDKSLFGSLCGNVYNTGVTGSFTSAGIADTGEGYVENCWTYSSATTMTTGIQGVFGNPTGANDKVQIVNSYYPETNAYSVTSNANGHGVAQAKPVAAFNNGEVAYDLNGFYLYKRYNDNASGLTTLTEKDYQYYDANALDDDGNMTLKSSSYIADGTTPDDFVTPLYIEGYRYGNEDFIYAEGVIPEGVNERYDSETGTYHPIWPDDYLFFGQTLTYGYVSARPHQSTPSHILKSDDRLLVATGNRVYRAPAYYRSAEMSVAHYNPDAIFAQSLRNDATVLAHKDMTAIDFTGYNDDTYLQGRTSSDPYDGAFYPPLLDNDGLTSFTNVNLTQNLLAYTPQATGTATDAATMTHTVISGYMTEPTYEESDATYRTVADITGSTTLHGHYVEQNGSDSYTAPVDHYLVDKQDFNAPISYSFASGKRMWYQRKPARYVDLSKGWEGISIPFSPELVTTQTKGEITHFYTGSTTGHEYWLRGFAGNVQQKTENNQPVEGVYTADFKYPSAGTDGTKTATNDFLWDYYYSKNPAAEGNAGQDANSDTYQTYYKASRTFAQYGYAVAATPYIIGFPGKTYYEFDLSGTFEPQNTYQSISRLDAQTITFASKTGAMIGVSDTELANSTTTADGYTFTPNYLGKDIPASATTAAYMLNAEGSAYQKLSATTAAIPFRPYFTTTVSSGARKREVADAIAFSSTTGIGEITPSAGDLYGGLDIFATPGKIVVESHRKTEARVRILTPTGITLATFILPPGERIETPVRTSGIYLVNTRKLHVSGR